MPSNRTTIIPPQDPRPTIASKTLKIVVLGDYLMTFNKADAQSAYPVIIKRRVIWYQQIPADLQEIFHGLPLDYSNIQAFSASTTNQVAHIITKNMVADNAEIMLAYNSAGLPQYNIEAQDI